MGSTTATEFRFQQFAIQQDACAMKVGTDGVLLGAWAPVEGRKNILDIGTGTGLIALMLAQRQPDARVVAVEIDEAAAQQAGQNATASPFAERLTVETSSVQDFSRQSQHQFDLIVSNPPFFSGGVLSDNLARAEVRHTIKLSHQDLLRSVQRLLSNDGLFCVILPWLEGLRLQEIARTYQLYPAQVCKVSPRVGQPANRILLAFSKDAAAEQVETTLTIYTEEQNTRSSEFAALTKDFYLQSEAV